MSDWIIAALMFTTLCYLVAAMAWVADRDVKGRK